MLRSWIVAAAVFASVSGSYADEFVVQPIPKGRPYPWTVLGVAPGQTAAAAKEAIEAKGVELETQRATLGIQRKDGSQFQTTIDVAMVTKGVSAATRMKTDSPLHEVQIDLDTGVLGGRVLGIERTVRGAGEEMPAYGAALQAQLESAFGAPSLVDVSGSGVMTIIYAWGMAGKIADLEKQELQTMVFDKGNGSKKEIEFQPCVSGGEDISSYASLLRKPIMPGCSAKLEVRFSKGVNMSTVKFRLVDYDLVRMNQEETDRQLQQALTGPVAPSKMDL